MESVPPSTGLPSTLNAAVPSPRSSTFRRERLASSQPKGSESTAVKTSPNPVRVAHEPPLASSPSTSAGNHVLSFLLTRQSWASMSPVLRFTSSMALASVTPSGKVMSRASMSTMVGRSSGRPSFTIRAIASMARSGVLVSYLGFLQPVTARHRAVAHARNAAARNRRRRGDGATDAAGAAGMAQS